MTCNPCGPYCRCHWTNLGISSWHGAHQVAQKLKSTTFPRRLARSRFPPLKSRRVNSGAFLLRRDSAAKAARAPAAAKPVPSSKLAIMRPEIQVRAPVAASGPANASPREPPLAAALNRVPLVNPIRSEVAGDIESLHVGESQIAQQLERGSDVGAAAPWATAAIEHDEGLPGERRHPVLQLLQARGLRPGPGVFGSRDMSLGKQQVRTHLQHQWLVCALGVQQAIQLLGLKQLRAGN